jgi:hypothetical protein
VDVVGVDVVDELGTVVIVVGAEGGDEITGIEEIETGEVVAAIGLTDSVGVLIKFDLGLNTFSLNDLIE